MVAFFPHVCLAHQVAPPSSSAECEDFEGNHDGGGPAALGVGVIADLAGVVAEVADTASVAAGGDAAIVAPAAVAAAVDANPAVNASVGDVDASATVVVAKPADVEYDCVAQCEAAVLDAGGESEPAAMDKPQVLPPASAAADRALAAVVAAVAAVAGHDVSHDAGNEALAAAVAHNDVPPLVAGGLLG